MSLENKPPVALEKISLAIRLAFPNLSHLVKATALVREREMLMTTKTRYNNSNFKTAMIAKTAHAAGCTYKSVQKTFESIGLMYLFGSADSKTHTFSNCSEPSFTFVSFHHLKPTNNLPEIFFKFQKSAETRSMRMIKWRMNLLLLVNIERIIVPKIYMKIGASRKNM